MAKKSWTTKPPPGFQQVKGRWYWRSPTIGADGKRESIPGGNTLEEAWRVYNRQIKHRVELRMPESGTIAELLERYEREEIPLKRSEETRREYKRIVGKLEQWCGSRPYAANEVEASSGRYFRRMDVAQYLRTAEAKVQANRTVAVLSDVFRAAAEWGLTEYNPCRDVRRNRETPRDRDPQVHEVNALVKSASPMGQLILRFMDITGARQKDVRELTIDDLEVEGVRVWQSKTGSKQLFEWTPELMEIICTSVRGKHGFLSPKTPGSRTVFVSPATGRMYTKWGIQSLFRRARAKASKAVSSTSTIRMHDIRAKAINDAKELGHDPRAFAGHTDQRTTDRHYGNRRARKVRPTR